MKPVIYARLLHAEKRETVFFAYKFKWDSRTYASPFIYTSREEVTLAVKNKMSELGLLGVRLETITQSLEEYHGSANSSD